MVLAQSQNYFALLKILIILNRFQLAINSDKLFLTLSLLFWFSCFAIFAGTAMPIFRTPNVKYPSANSETVTLQDSLHIVIYIKGIIDLL